MSETIGNVSTQEWLGAHRLPDQRLVRFRRIQSSDEALITTAINSASPETLLHRFFSPVRQVSPEMLRRMLSFDPQRETCIVGLVETTTAPRLICGARYVRLAATGWAEIALTVHDDFQRAGLGIFMLRLLARLAVQDDVKFFTAEVLSSNDKMLRLLRKISAGGGQGAWSGEVYHAEIPIAQLLP